MVNSVPTLGDFATAITLLENTVNAAPQLLDADVAFSDPDDNFDGGTLVVSGLLAEDTVSIRNQGDGAGKIGLAGGTVSFGGVEIGAVSGGAGAALTVTFNAQATSAAIEALIENLTYANASDTPTASRTLTVVVTDDEGADTGSSAQIVVGVTAQNDAPSLTGLAPSVSFLENTVNATPQLLDANVTFSDPDNNFSGGTLLIAGLLAEDIVSIRNEGAGAGEIGLAGGTVSFGGVAIGTVSGGAGGDLSVTFNGAATSQAIEALIENLTYANTSNTPTASRALTVEVTDAAGAATLGTALSLADAGFLAGIDVDRYSVPTLGDLDADGDLDILVANIQGQLFTISNTGTAAAPVFGAPVQIAGIATNNFAAPTLGDLDGDGDLDIVVGSHNGALLMSINAGTSVTPAFGAPVQLGITVPGNFMSAPALGDLDGDGDLDMVVGNGQGQLFTIANTGSSLAPAFGAPVQLAGIDVGSSSKPALGDLDGDGDLEIVVGNSSGDLFIMTNTGTAAAAVFGAPVEVAGGTDSYAAPGLGDIDGDGDLDIVLGGYSAGLQTVLGSSDAQMTVNVTAEVDSPTLTGLGPSVYFLENAVNAAPQLIDAEVTFADPHDNFATGTLVVSGLLGEDTVSIRNQGNGAGQIGLAAGTVSFGGVAIGTVSGGGAGGNLTVTFNGAANSASIEALVENLTYANASDTPTATRTLTIEVTDGPGIAGTAQIAVNVTPQIDAPTLTGLAPSVTLLENAVNAAPQLLDADVTFTDQDDDFSGGTLVVSGLLAEDTVSIRNQGGGTGEIGLAGATVSFGGVAIGTVAGGIGGAFTVTFNSNANSASIEALIENLTYANASDTPTASRALTIEVTDAAGGSTIGPALSFAPAATNPLAHIDLDVFSTAALGDLDGDGDLDVVAGDNRTSLFTITNNGTATAPVFGVPVAIAGVSLNYSKFALGDLDRDGDLDIVARDFFGSFYTITNTGTPAAPVFGPPAQIAGIGSSYRHPTLGDLDGDGDLDMVVGDNTGRLFTITNNGTALAPAFGVATEIAGIDVGYNSAPALGDLDGDGDLDIVVGNYNALFTITNTGTAAAFAFGSPVYFIGHYFGPALGDLDGDGDLDIVAGGSDGNIATFLGSSDPQISVNVTAENDAPSLTGFAPSVTLLENTVNVTPQLLDTDAGFTDPDNNFADGTLVVSGLLAEDTLSIRDQGNGGGQIGFSAGTVLYSGVAIGTVAGGAGGDLIVTFNGAATSAAIQALIENLTYANSSGAPTASRTLTVEVTDNAGAGTTAQIVIDVTAENDAPSLTGLAPSVTLLEDTVNAGPQLLDTDVSFSDPEDNFGGSTLVVSGLLAEDTVSIRNQGNGAGEIGLAGGTVSYGSLAIGTVSGGVGGNLIVTFNGAADSAAIEALIENLTYANSSDTPTAGRTLTVEVTDAEGANTGGTAQIAVNVTAENDAPTLTGLAPFVTFLEDTVNAAPQLLDADVAFMDLDADYAGGTLVVSGVLAEDTVSIRSQGIGAGEIELAGGTVSFGGVAIGTVSGGAGGDLTVNFNGAADSAAIEALIENLTYANASDAPTTSRMLTVAVADAGGASTDSTIAVNVTAENDAPTLTGLIPSLTLLESSVNASPQLLAADVGFVDPDFSGGTLVVSGLLAEDTVSIRNQGGGAGQIGFAAGTLWFGGVEIGTASGGAGGGLTVTLNSAADAAAIEALIENLTYANASATPTASRTLTVEVTDAGGAGPSSAAQIAVNVTAENDAPSLTDVAPSVTLLENTVNASPQLLDADVGFADPEENFSGGTLVVSGLLAEDTVSIRNQGVGAGEIGFAAGTVSFGGVAIGTAAGGAGGDLTVTFNGAAGSAAIEALIENLTYLNSSSTPTATRTLTFQVTDDIGANTRSAALNFAEFAGTDNPFDNFVVGTGFLDPALGDLDGDGDLDIVVGDFLGGLTIVTNTGTPAAPVLGPPAVIAGIDVGLQSAATLGDLDGDGDLDMVVGSFQGRLFTITNTGTAAAPVFNASIHLSALDLFYRSSPALGDLDGDGDLDLVVGYETGELFTAAAPVFGWLVWISGIDLGVSSSPTLGDLDGDGDFDIVVGNNDGLLFTITNAGTLAAPVFGAPVQITGIDVGDYATPALGDLDGDGNLDLVVGNSHSQMHLFMGSHDPHIVVNVTAQNDAPSGADNGVTTSEDTAYSFTAADFGFSDGVDNNALLAVEITTLPAAGALTLDDVAVNAGDFISVADIDAGKLKFVPFENAHGASYAGFSFQVQDDGGTANSGADLDPSANTITIDVVSVNDAPSGASSTITAVEDTARVLTAADFGFSDAIDGDAFSAVTIGNLPAAGTLLNNGVAVTAGQSVSIADINAGHLAFQAALNANGAGYASFDFHVQDDGGTSNGGVDLDQTANTLTIDVTAVNDAPGAVVLSNQRGSFAENVSTTARIKVADIAIADVDGGGNNLSLAGLDAGLFQIIGQGLWLKAGARLDFETNPRLDVTVRVDDPTVGGPVDAFANLSIAIADIVETVTGTARPDRLAGGNHSENLNGLAGNDAIYGNGGNDRITGGLGADFISGGAGRDVFAFGSIGDSAPGQSGLAGGRGAIYSAAAGHGLRDVVTDFTRGQDRVDFSAIDANNQAFGNQAFSFRGQGHFTSAPAQLIYRLYDVTGTAGDKTIVYGDVNGDGRADFQVELTGLKALTASDFVL